MITQDRMLAMFHDLKEVMQRHEVVLVTPRAGHLIPSATVDHNVDLMIHIHHTADKTTGALTIHRSKVRKAGELGAYAFDPIPNIKLGDPDGN